jgi:GNAT superfamily N-acetyltransferase
VRAAQHGFSQTTSRKYILDMNIQFKTDYNPTMVFEECYENELRIDPEERKDIIKSGLVIYMYGPYGLIGECYGATPFALEFIDETPEDCSPDDDESIYVYSTTILPSYQGKGHGKQLIEAFARHASDQGYVKLVGHATTPAMKHLREQQGAIFHEKGIHEKWYGTDRTAHFYTQFLTQDKDYNCGPVALAYLLERMGTSALVYDLEDLLVTEEEYGTDPKSIEYYLRDKKIPYERTGMYLRPNSIIDITVGEPGDEDGHWIVLIEPQGSNWYKVYDPETGLGAVMNEVLMNKWHSPRYGKNQGFTLL